ncbi:hypothetical protein G7046_g5993 [Stylonectria norvegica]|nr:hypothetical protein G7046_g5993 [Stylonectria norvegica]
MSLENFPFLNQDEFSEACHHLERQYCRAALGRERVRWRLNVCTALNTEFSMDGGCTTYIQIRRPLQTDLDHGDLSLALDSFSMTEGTGEEASLMADRDMMDAEDLDEALLVKHLPGPDVGVVQYEIHLHPTYRVPCLWFTLRGLPLDEPAFNIDTVFRRLVPDEYKAGLRTVNGIGGISADHHPITGVPSFFVHPCLLGDAISNFECDRANYLMIWLGLVGGCVGLWVPKEMAMQ